MNRLARTLALTVTVAALAVSTATGASAAKAPAVKAPAVKAKPKPVSRLTPAEAQSAADWIRSAQLPNGAIATFPDKQRVQPNMGNQAAQGLADHARRTGDTASLEAAWAHLRWYAAAEDANGVVTDYVAGPDGALTSTGTADSTSGYAGTFLAAVESAYNATPPKQRAARLASVATGIDGALRAIASVARTDGLYDARPDYHLVYLMREAEAYAGLDSAARLLRLLDRPKDAVAATRAAKRLAKAVDRLWNPTTQGYDWAIYEDGRHETTKWQSLYPDGVANAWVVAYGLVPPKRAKALMEKVTTTFPTLLDPATGGYWAETVLAYRYVKDRPQAALVLGGITAQATATGRAWPYTTETAGVSLTISLAD
jgi:hypothetical protein